MKPRHLVALWAAFALAETAAAQAASRTPTPWYDGLGRYSRAISTTDAGARGYFNQGLIFLMALNPDEAIRSFEEAARYDPKCAMVYWGLALSHGPLLGLPAPDEAANAAAVAALNRAHELAGGAKPVEQALIAALTTRYADPLPVDRRPLDLAYAAALREVWRAYPDDPDVGAWLVQALLLAEGGPRWSPFGQPLGLTAEAIEVLERVRAAAPRHPLGNRLTVLVWERSPDPAQADPAASQLRRNAPGLGHLLHLATRIDVPLGRWHQAIETNQQALVADQRYAKLSGGLPERYRLVMAQHRLMLVYAAMMTGRSGLALQEAQALVASVPLDWAEVTGAPAEGLTAARLQALVRFGRWREVLAEKAPPVELPVSRVWRHATRQMAFAALGDLPGARAEAEALARAAEAIGPEDVAAGGPASEWAAVALQMAAGALHHAAGEPAAAVAALEAAVTLQDALPSAGPRPWMLPPRHLLGAVLLDQERLDEAESVYRRDLAEAPDNGWALAGLARVLHRQERLEEAALVEQRLAGVWRGDTEEPVGSWPQTTTVAAAAPAVAER